MFKKTLVLIAVLSIFVFGFGCQKPSQETQQKQIQKEEPGEASYPEPEPEPESKQEAISWKEIEEGRYLPVPYYYQKDVAKYGSYACGPTALKMILEYKKQTGEINQEVLSISDLIREIGVKSDVWADSNLDNFFIENFGITDVALKKLALELGFPDTIIFGKNLYPQFPASLAIDPEHQGQIIDGKNFKALIDQEGWEIEKLYNTVQEGKPVIVDVTVNLDPLYGPNDLRSYTPFYTEDGDQHWELMFGKGHFMVVIGFKNWGKDKAEIILLDPLKKTDHPDKISIYSLEQFKKSWELLNNQGILN